MILATAGQPALVKTLAMPLATAGQPALALQSGVAASASDSRHRHPGCLSQAPIAPPAPRVSMAKRATGTVRVTGKACLRQRIHACHRQILSTAMDPRDKRGTRLMPGTLAIRARVDYAIWLDERLVGADATCRAIGADCHSFLVIRSLSGASRYSSSGSSGQWSKLLIERKQRSVPCERARASARH